MGIDALAYLRKRGLSENSIKKFRLGFSQNSYQALTNFLEQAGCSSDAILRSGVIGKNSQNKLYDKLRNRVIFPIFDKRGQAIAFGGRSLRDEMPKYLNSAETDLFKKNQTLYNLSFARKPTWDHGCIVVVEGYMDVISLSTNGVENVVAGLGTAIGEAHIKELFHLTDKVIICLDGDTAGIRAAKRVTEISMPLINHQKNIYFSFLPKNFDPDDFIREFGHREFDKVTQSATPLSKAVFDFTLAEIAANRSGQINAELKAKIEAALFSKIDVIKDVTTKKHFSAFFRDSLFHLGRNFKKNSNKTTNFNKAPSKIYASYIPPQGDINKNIREAISRNIVAMIINFPQLADYRDDIFDIKEVVLGSEDLTKIKDSVTEAIDNNPKIATIDLMAILEQQGHLNDKLRNAFTNINYSDITTFTTKFKILLLKDLLLQVDSQYKATLKKVDEIDTHQTAITNHKVKEIFEYKNSLEHNILELESNLLN